VQPAVASLFRYPVKSMMGEELNSTYVTGRGLYGDRAFALVDGATGKIASAKNPRKWPSLFAFRAVYATPVQPDRQLGAVRITFPDGTSATSEQPEIDAALSGVLGTAVTLRSVPPALPELEEYWPDMDGLNHRDAVTNEAMPASTFFDCAQVHILTTATLAALQRLHPEGRIEVRRFRPNVVVTMPGRSDFADDEWVGKTLAIGSSVRVRVTGPCPRCVMTTLAQGDLPHDNGILRTAARHNGGHVGVYAEVITGGAVHIGDAVTVA